MPGVDDGAARQRVVELLGLPRIDSLRPTAVRRAHLRTDRGVRFDRVELDTADHDMIPCLVLTPTTGAVVDVIAVHQHAGVFTTGKSEPAGLGGDPTLAYGLRLARAGARVVVPDLLGFEERRRRWTDDDGADERLDALFRVADGSSLQAKHTRDVAVVTSWTAEDGAARDVIGVVGHSLGGQVALFSLAVDPRVTRGVLSCGVGTLASFRAGRIRHNPAWFVPGLVAAGDVPLVAAAVDQPVLVAAGRADGLFPMSGVEEVLAAFRPELVTAVISDGGHSLPPSVLDAAVEHLLIRGAD